MFWKLLLQLKPLKVTSQNLTNLNNPSATLNFLTNNIHKILAGTINLHFFPIHTKSLDSRSSHRWFFKNSQAIIETFVSLQVSAFLSSIVGTMMHLNTTAPKR